MAAATVISTVAENAGLIHIVVFVVSAGVAAKVKCRAGEDTKGRRLTILRRPGYARSAPRASATPAAEPATIQGAATAAALVRHPDGMVRQQPAQDTLVPFDIAVE